MYHWTPPKTFWNNNIKDIPPPLTSYLLLDLWIFHFAFFRGIYQIVPIYGATVTVNRAFYEGTHFIEYKAVDDGGNFDSCSFTVTVNGKCFL